MKLATEKCVRRALATFVTLMAVVVLAVGGGSVLAAETADGATTVTAAIKSLTVYPPEIQLFGAQAQQPLVVQATYADGVTRDVSDEAQLSLGDEATAQLRDSVVMSRADGVTQLAASFDGLKQQVPVRVRDASTSRPLSFRNDVIPALTKTGCNAGACHGASRGKDGFNLSLLGYDPVGDHHRLTQQESGRRINLALPSESMLLEKATGRVPHTGGVSFNESSPHYQTLLGWLELGAPDDAETAVRVQKVEVFPPAAVMHGEGTQQRIRVLATFSDDTVRDVTSLARISTSNEFAATIDDAAVVTAVGRGEAFLTVDFDVHTVGAHFIVLPSELAFEWPDVREVNYVDTLVNDKLKKLRIYPSPLASDAEFLRRVTLDITGRLPTAEEYAAFVDSDAADKRATLVDELLERPEFVDIWVMKWADLLQMRTGPKIGRKSLMRYHSWLREQIAAEVPLDKMAHSLLAANGGTFSNAATNYYQSEDETLKTAENAAQVFLGMRLKCAQCHNHMFDRWTMDDYYGFAAFFAHVGRKPGEDPRETIIYNKGSGAAKHPLTKKALPPRFLGAGDAEVDGKDRRVVLADWVVAADNPYFARHMANMTWAHFFGKGIVDPVDDVRVSNPPVNPQLLDELSRRLVEYKFQVKPLIRDICNSRTYQLSAAPNESNLTDERNFSHAGLRRLPAPVMLDVVSQVTNTTDKFKDMPEGSRAVQIPDGATTNYFLVTFGRSARESVCTCESRAEPNLSQALHLINGKTVQGKIGRGKVIQSLRKQGKSPMEVVDSLYIRTLSRTPNEQERAIIESELKAAAKKGQVLNDVFWALLNSQEFLFNH